MAEASTQAAPAAPTTTPAPEAKAAPAAAPAAKAEEATEAIKVNGKEVKVTPSQLRMLAQKGYFADQRLKSADVLVKNSEKLISALKSPAGILGLLNDPSLGVTKDALFDAILASDASDATKEKLARWVHKNVVLESKKSPEEIERDKKLARLEQLESEKAQREKDTKEQQESAQLQQAYKVVKAEVTREIVADKFFPQNEVTIRSVIDKLRVMNKKGLPVTPDNIKKAMQSVKNDFFAHQQALLDASEEPEDLIRLIGEPRALKIARGLAKRLRAKEAAKLEKKGDEPQGRKVTEDLDEKLGRTRQGFKIMKL